MKMQLGKLTIRLNWRGNNESSSGATKPPVVTSATPRYLAKSCIINSHRLSPEQTTALPHTVVREGPAALLLASWIQNPMTLLKVRLYLKSR